MGVFVTKLNPHEQKRDDRTLARSPMVSKADCLLA